MGIHVLAQEVLQKSSIEECSVTELEALVNRYPYFAPARFLYAQKLQKEGAPTSEKALSRAILYYPSPLSFFEFIQPERFEIESAEFEEKEKDKEKEEEFVLVPDIEEEEEEKQKDKEKEEEKEEEFVLVPDIEEDDDAGLESEEESESEEEEEGLRNSASANYEEPRISIPKIKEEPVKETDSLFMPYHTVDYFASQGIKLGREETTNDRFGKQLLSFTEWLKTLKKGPTVSPEASTQKPEALPTDSVNTTEIYTEAMAEVWIKQGNKEKAIEVYNKLSLLNPSKKAYFAAKIDHLSKT